MMSISKGVITVRRGKNGKARFVPVAPSTVDRLAAYRAERLRLLGPERGRSSAWRRAAADRLLRTLQLRAGLPGHRSARAPALLQARPRAAHP